VSAQGGVRPYRGQGYLTFGLGPGSYRTSPLFKEVSFGGEGFLYKGLGVGGEVAYASYGGYDRTAWIGSVDISYHFGRHAAPGKVDPFLLGGLSVVGPTQRGGGRGSPAGNFGGGLNVWVAQHAALRFEVRDVVGAEFWTYTHNVTFRFGVTFR
jgi:hypothetical protein